MSLGPQQISPLREAVDKGIKAHSPTFDSLYHNGGTALALAATAIATVLPTSYSAWAKGAAAFATFVIALSRALDFGGRWRWHIEMRTGYIALGDRVAELEGLPDPEQLEAWKKIYDRLEVLRARESGVPGAGSTSSASNT